MLTSCLPKSRGCSLSNRRAEIESPKIYNKATVLGNKVFGRRSGLTLRSKCPMRSLLARPREQKRIETKVPPGTNRVHGVGMPWTIPSRNSSTMVVSGQMGILDLEIPNTSLGHDCQSVFIIYDEMKGTPSYF